MQISLNHICYMKGAQSILVTNSTQRTISPQNLKAYFQANSYNPCNAGYQNLQRVTQHQRDLKKFRNSSSSGGSVGGISTVPTSSSATGPSGSTP